MPGLNDLAEARRQADVARERFRAALCATGSRIAPTRLKDDAVLAVTDRIDHARANVRRTIRRRPILSFSLIGALLALILWRPARAAARHGASAFARLRGAIDQWRDDHGANPQAQDD